MTNKEIAKLFLLQTSKGQVDDVFERYVADNFKHHNVFLKGDKASLKDAMFLSGIQSPNRTLEIHQTIAEKDKVVIHSHIKQDQKDRGAAVVHIFSFQQGKIVELWDLGQKIPEEIENENGMF